MKETEIGRMGKETERVKERGEREGMRPNVIKEKKCNFSKVRM